MFRLYRRPDFPDLQKEFKANPWHWEPVSRMDAFSYYDDPGVVVQFRANGGAWIEWFDRESPVFPAAGPYDYDSLRYYRYAGPAPGSLWEARNAFRPAWGAERPGPTANCRAASTEARPVESGARWEQSGTDATKRRPARLFVTGPEGTSLAGIKLEAGAGGTAQSDAQGVLVLSEVGGKEARLTMGTMALRWLGSKETEVA